QAPGTPASAAAAAPGKAIIDSVCPAKASPRSTITQPTTPDITATTLPASSALSMKWYSRSCLTSSTTFQLNVGLVASADAGMRVLVSLAVLMTVVVMRRRLWLAGDDEGALRSMPHLDS